MSNPFSSPDPYAGSSVGPNPFAPDQGAGVNPFAPVPDGPFTPLPDDLFAPRSADAGVSDAVDAPSGRPVSVKASAGALLLGGLLTLALAGFGVFIIFDMRDSFDRLIQLDPSHTATFLVTDYADDTETVLTVCVVAIAAMLTVSYMLVARSVWKGSNWPRNVSPFLVVLSLPAVFLGVVGILIVASGAVATAAAWLPSARAYAALRGKRVT